MESSRFVTGVVRRIGVAALASALAACGGGGGDSGPSQPAATVDLGTGNRDSVSHASAAAILALSPIDVLPVASGFGVAPGWARRVLAPPTPTGRGHAVEAEPGHVRAQALNGPFVDPCVVSGTVTSSIDDRDDSQTVTAGDVLTIVYSDCRDSPFVAFNGSVVSTYLMVSPDALSARVTMNAYSQTAARHAITLDGSMLLDFVVPNSSQQTMTLTADGPLVATVTTHLYSDTVTLTSGFVETTTADSSGRAVTSLRGSLDSVTVGGIVQVSTRPASPLVQYGFEAYPRSGVVQVDGRRGRLLMTALDAETVQLDLDAESDGNFESSTAVTWDWVL